MKLSNTQLCALEDIAAAELMGVTPGSGTLYAPTGFTETVHYFFNSSAHQQRWLKSLESRGLIVIDRGTFLRLTDMSRQYLKKAPKANRRDYHKEAAERERQLEAVES